MFYRVTKYDFAPERYDEILAWADSNADKIRSIDGLIAVDTFIAGEGDAMIVASYESEAAFTAGSETVARILGDMGQFMTSAPMTSSGTVDWTTRS